MRHIYLDEAGISSNDQEPHYIVAAAITNPDRHWHEIVNYYDDLAGGWLDWFDVEEHGHFIFHAKDVWHGSGVFRRDKFSLQDRMKIFRQLAQAPDLLAIPICRAIVDKSLNIDDLPQDPVALKQIHHGIAFGVAMQSIDFWMEENCPGQVCMVTAENTDSVKAALKLIISEPQTSGRGYTHECVKQFKTRSIVDSINFSEKRHSPIMQMADHCAFIVRRHLSGKCNHIGKYYDAISAAIYDPPVGYLPRPFQVFHK